MRLQLKQILYSVIAACMFILVVLCGQVKLSAYADSDMSVQAAYELSLIHISEPTRH